MRVYYLKNGVTYEIKKITYIATKITEVSILCMNDIWAVGKTICFSDYLTLEEIIKQLDDIDLEKYFNLEEGK